MGKKTYNVHICAENLENEIIFFFQIHICKNWLGGKAQVLTLQILISDFVQKSNASQTS